MNEYPYNNNGAPYPGGNPYQGGAQNRAPEAPRGGLSYFFHSEETRPHRTLFFTANVLGLGFLGYLLMSTVFTIVLRDVPVLKDLYLNQPLYTYLIDILYSALCVGLPFLVVYGLLKRTQFHKRLELPFSGAGAPKKCLLLVPAALGVCFIGSLASNYFAAYADAFGCGFTSYYEALEPDPLPEGLLGLLVITLRSALVPAMIEEFAFRGVVLQSLRKYGDWFAITVSAILFGLMHANMTQVPFAIIAGVALAYCAVVTGSLKTGILVHFLNNFVSVVVSVAVVWSGEDAANLVSSVVIYGVIAVGLLCLAVYAMKTPGCFRLRRGPYGRIRKKGRLTFLAPVLLAACLWLLWYTVMDIEVFAGWVMGG